MKRIFNFFIVLFGVLFISSCSEVAKVKGSNIDVDFEAFKDSLYTNYEAGVAKKNKVLLNTLFDSVAYNSLNLVLRDRAYESNPNDAPNLKGVKLDKMKSKIKGASQNDDAIRNYIDKFSALKKGFHKEGLSKKRGFKNQTNGIVKSEVYLQNILKDKAEDSLYKDLDKQIGKFITTAQGKYAITKTKSEWSKIQETSLRKGFNIQQEKKKKSTQDFYSILKNNSVLFFSLLIISLLLNLIIGLLWFRNRKKRKKAEIQEDDVIHEKVQESVPISSLSSSDVSSYVSEIFKKTQESLASKYHTDCLETEIKNLQSHEADLSKRSLKKQFKNQHELIAFASPLAIKYETQIAKKLNEILDKQSAQKYLEQQLDTENFVLKYASSIVSDEEMRSKVTILKKRFLDEIPEVISKSDLEIEEQNLRTIIISTIEKMIAKNSQLYFPYADAQGILYDDKKSKEKERDSAIKLTLNPKENTRASFQLLYEYSDMMLAGIQSYDILLLPICDLKSDDFDRNGNKISQNGNDGQMILENGQWKVNKKLSIKIT